jgi:glycosyltransferase involved in cell wall biosynthesis
MNVSIYNASWETMGGGEKYLCALADVVSRDPVYSVTLLVDRPDVTAEKLRKFFDLGLERVTLQHVDAHTRDPLLSAADIAILQTNWKPLRSSARRTVYILHVPYGPLGPGAIAGRILHGELKESIKDVVRSRLLREARHASASVVNSLFARGALLRHHGIEATCIQPAIDDFLRPIAKEKIILSVGRFFRGLYNDKRYDVMIDAFRKLTARQPDHGWEYWVAGSCGNDASSQRHLARLREAARGLPVVFHVNPPYVFLTECYNRAAIFWHAAGFEVDQDRHPERMEHFGMTTVEAMTARCIPVVYDGGGQREIVANGKSGFFWKTKEQLVATTLSVMNDSALSPRIADGARERSLDFSHARFTQNVSTFFHELPAHHHG